MDNSRTLSQHSNQNNMPQLSDPKNSRILNRKQIEKRLQNLKPSQYNRISSNLANQNRRLKQEVKDLHEKVQQLIIAKKIPDLNNQKNPLIEEEIKRMKKELNLKYESMNYLKEQILQAKATDMTEEMKNQVKHKANEINHVEREIKQLSKEREELNHIYSANVEAYEEYHPKKDQNYEERINAIREDNRELKRKIFEHSSADKAQEKNSQQVLDKFYNLKSEEQRYMKAILDSKNSRKKLTVNDVKTIDIGEISSIQKEILMLKEQKKEAEKELVNEKILKQHKKGRLQKQIRQLMDEHKELLRRRMKALNQLNLYESKDRKHKELIEEKEQKAQVVTEDKASQTDKIIPKDFRKDWIGKSEGIFSFDDSLNLDYRSQIYVKGVMIYKNVEHICCVKFYYESIHKKRYETRIPIQSAILRKYDCKKYMAKANSYLKNFTVCIFSDKVIRIEFMWSDGEVIGEGYEIQGCTKYTADIGPEERPISMFGSYTFQGKNNYSLESLGCEINSNEAEN